MTVHGFYKLKAEIGSQKIYQWPFRQPDVDGDKRTAIVYATDIIVPSMTWSELLVLSPSGNKYGVRIPMEDLQYFDETLVYNN